MHESQSFKNDEIDLRRHIRTIPDYPKEGVQFRDITSLLIEPAVFQYVVHNLAGPHVGNPVDKVAALDARGFVFGAPVAMALDAGLVLLRKEGKLPGETLRETYDLEYGSNVGLELQTSDVAPGERVLLIDDILATGGTAEAAITLLRKAGAEVVEAAFVVDLPGLGGSERIRNGGVPVRALVAFDGA